ncbi:MAG: cytochrome C [Desulfuromonas sp.]|nr:MAG: cytochrome C [Desulfuromonas sp.]
MKTTAVAVLLLLSSSAWGLEGTPLALGETLFEATSLGTNQKSCASCHPGGEGLDEIAVYDDDQLKEMINFCIRDALKGEMMPLESQEIEAMFLYLRHSSLP